MTRAAIGGYPPAVPRVSISQVTTGAWPFGRDVAAIAAAGARGIGVTVRKLDAVGVPTACRLVRDAGLDVACVTASGLFPLGDPVGEAAALARARGHLAAAAELRAGCLMLVTGPPGPLAWEEAAARLRPLVAALVADAERLGVRLALEPTSALRRDISFLHSFDDALDLVDGFASPWLGVVLELNSAWSERRLYENVRTRADRIALVQVSDFRVGTMTASTRVMIGDGDIPLRRLCGAIAEAGYGGWWDLELLGPEIDALGPDRVVPLAVERFQALWR